MFQTEKQKFEACYNEYADMLYRIALSYLKNAYDAEDAVQDTFIKYMHHVIPFRDESHKRAWLIRVVINRCKDMQKRQTDSPLEDAAGIPHPDDNSPVMWALNELEPKYRIAVTLHYLEGFSVEEGASILGIKLSAMKMRLSRGRQMLKEIIEKENSDV